MAKILIVDDEQGMRQLLSLVFGRAHRVSRAPEDERQELPHALLVVND